MQYYEYDWERTKAGSVRLLGVYGQTEEAKVPESVSGLPVTELAPYCFAPDGHLPGHYETTAFVYDGEQELWQEKSEAGHSKDRGCMRLCGSCIKRLTLPDTVESIGNLAFYNCTALEKIELGNRMEQLGSDVFMNCRSLHALVLRCGIGEKSGARKILAQLPGDVTVTFLAADGEKTVVFYPEYTEHYDEIAPAHIFGRSIEGEGFRARQCFRDGVADLTQYDTIFKKACAEESADTLRKIVCTRLEYPAGMTETAKSRYLEYLSAHGTEICVWLTRQKSIETIARFCENGWLPRKAVEESAAEAARGGWAEGAALLLHLKKQYFKAPAQERYTFDDF